MTDATIPAVGKRAPAFSLESDERQKVRFADLKGRPFVLYFYPKDATPGYTTEANEFRVNMKHFNKLGVAVFGVSPDSVDSHCKFIDRQKLNFRLLADPNHKAAEKYGVWVEKNMYGKKFWGVQRATFLINADGKVAAVWPKVSPRGHAAEVLAAAREL